MLASDIKATISITYGRMRSSLPGFAARKDQVQMIRDVAQVVAAGAHGVAVFEAGTGLGKSMGYAIGAIPVAHSLGKRVIISTATVALQEQLFNKDLPFFASCFKQDIKIVLAKGSSRYACPSRMLTTATEADLFFDEQSADKNAVANDAAVETLYKELNSGAWSGDIDKLPEPPSPALLKRIARDKHTCTKRSCAHYKVCPFYAARRDLAEADVIVTNHSLLLADAGSGDASGRILAGKANGDNSDFEGGLENCVLVLDEGHHVPAVAGNSCVHHYSLKHSISWMSAMPRVARLAQQAPVDSDKVAAAAGEISDLARQLSESTVSLRTALLSIPATSKLETDNVFRFAGGLLPAPIMPLVTNAHCAATGLCKALDRIVSGFNNAITKDRSLESRISQALSNALFVWQKASSLLDTLSELIKAQGSGGNHAVWLESTSNGDLGLHVAAINVGEYLVDTLFDVAHATILCSATLRTMNSFDRFSERAGISGRDGVLFKTFESPFPYHESRLLVPRSGHNPNSEAHRAWLATQIPVTVGDELGSLFIFTSRAAMNAVHSQLPTDFAAKVLVQGKLSKSAIIDTHSARVRAGQQSVIFGLMSFAEGVDLKNDLCTVVGLDKLPFASMGDQIMLAESELFERRGRNPFNEITLPECSATLRQVAGRLIRTESDRGTVVIFDERIVSKAYGRRLMSSLPCFMVDFI